MRQNRIMRAILVKPVDLPFGLEIIPVDTTIWVDVEKSVALWGDKHFDIHPDEYILLN